MHTEEQIKEAIKNLPNLTEDELSHNYKCASATKHKAYHGFMQAIEKELQKRKPTKQQENINDNEK